jgi:hypothetical protein
MAANGATMPQPSDMQDEEVSGYHEEFETLQHKFDEIIKELPAYGPSLARIKMEYERILKIITDSNRVRSLIRLERHKKSTNNQTFK